MPKLLPFIAALTAISLARADIGQPSQFDKGIADFEGHRWVEAIGEFVRVVTQDPKNAKAHEYLALAIEQLEAERRGQVHDWRLQMLEKASRRLEDNRLDATRLRQDIEESAQAEAHQRQERLHAQCQMAVVENRLGHLPAANDLVLRVLAEDQRNIEAQRILTDLQSQIHQKLDENVLPIAERYTLEGFYAYGQADYHAAFAAWTKARGAIEELTPVADVARQIADLHFEDFLKTAENHVRDDELAAEARSHFDEGLKLYEKKSFDQALESFRQVALLNPEYPQLGQYLVQSESEVEKERVIRLGSEKRQRITDALAKGLAAFEQANYALARQYFKSVLTDDPSDNKARLYLAQADAQKDPHPDPAAAEQHFEAGVIAYAGGHEDEALREWHIARRLDPANQKVIIALNKVKEEQDYAREVP